MKQIAIRVPPGTVQMTEVLALRVKLKEAQDRIEELEAEIKRLRAEQSPKPQER